MRTINLVKPFSPRELVLRIRAILRRIEGREEAEAAQIVAGPLAIDLVGCQVQIDSDPVDLTATEFQALDDPCATARASAVAGGVTQGGMGL